MKFLPGQTLILFIVLVIAAGCSGTNGVAKKTTPSGASYVDVKEGEGPAAKFGDVVFFSYVGKLPDGRLFGKRERTNPATTRIGFHSPIVGLDEGLDGVKLGGVRTIWVPAKLGYGTRGSLPNIPPNSDLVFEDVEVVKVAKPPEESKEGAPKESKQSGSKDSKEVTPKESKEAAPKDAKGDTPKESKEVAPKK